MSLVEKINKAADLRAELRDHEAKAQEKSDELRRQILAISREISLDGAGLDLSKIDLARSLIFVRGSFARGGEERQSVIADAVHHIATGRSPTHCRSLNIVNYGTKSYDRWHGQRCDCEPFMGPRHGSIIFQIGITDNLRERGGVDALTDDEREAVVYMLTRIEAVQAAEAKAAA